MKTKKDLNGRIGRRASVVAYVAIASIVSGLGGLIKLPSPVGSVALDAVPGLFSAVYYGPLVGGIVGFIGHMLSAASGGFPLGFVHFLIALGIFVVCWTFGAIARTINKKWGLIPAGIVAIILNNLIPFLNAALGLMPFSAAVALVFPFLLVAAAINVGIASLMIIAIRKVKAPEI
ncbi:ECF transporter S component [Haloferula sp.]|uniref:ECF transporter S component n=1 Tax=Haloferula sp. TaxID=2497595 RepID=UPI003C7686FE